MLYSHLGEPTKDISVVSANTETGKFALLFKETFGGSILQLTTCKRQMPGKICFIAKYLLLCDLCFAVKFSL